jgi:hypothetical protein
MGITGKFCGMSTSLHEYLLKKIHFKFENRLWQQSGLTQGTYIQYIAVLRRKAELYVSHTSVRVVSK